MPPSVLHKQHKQQTASARELQGSDPHGEWRHAAGFARARRGGARVEMPVFGSRHATRADAPSRSRGAKLSQPVASELTYRASYQPPR
eukprot:scaffold67718_cov45-Phaeocystis_antarctica.AAC.1